MYGLVIESIVAFIRKNYGDDKWLEIRKFGKIEQHSFSTHLIYPETTIPRLVETASDLLGVTREEFLTQLGRFFVTFVSQYGYDKILRVLGRHMRDFLNGLDNLHEYMRFSYPKLRPPSFFVEKETEHGLMLHYRSKRRYGGYVRYVMGQIKSVGESFYGLDVDIDVVKEEFVGNMVHVTMQLRFDNAAFLMERTASQDTLDDLRIESDLFFDAFPFHIVFTEDLIIKSAGLGLSNVMPSIEGHDISHVFVLRRPMVEFAWEQILSHTNNVFELESVDVIQKKEDYGHDYQEDELSHRLSFESQSDISDSTTQEGMKLHLKGQMIWTPEWQAILFLGTPVLPHLTAMFDTGLFINDLSLHDNSRDLVLAGTQTSAELKLALDQEQVKSKKLEDNMKKLDEEMRRTDELLYQMIPRQIADRLRAGEPALDTCQVFDHVTILFSDVVGFTLICSRISPLQVVNMLNSMYSKFDHLCALHEIYKVETIGDAYVVVSGAPEEVDDHAERIADMALGMIDTMQVLVDPSTGNHLQIRVGLNSGVVVAGVVGLKMPRYCLFGDTVNTAAKMESSSDHMRIQMTQSTMHYLKDNSNYTVTDRGLVDIKDKGKLYTYWLEASPSYQSRVSNNINNEAKISMRPEGLPKISPPVQAQDSFGQFDDDSMIKPSMTRSPASMNGIAKRDIDDGNRNSMDSPDDVQDSQHEDLEDQPLLRKTSTDFNKSRKYSSPAPVLIFDSKQNGRLMPDAVSVTKGPVRPLNPASVSPRPSDEEQGAIKRVAEFISTESLSQPVTKKSMIKLEHTEQSGTMDIPARAVKHQRRELSSPVPPSDHRPIELQPVVFDSTPKKPPKLGFSPFDTSSSEYEGGDAAIASDSDSFSRSDSIESARSRRRDSDPKQASAAANRTPIFSIRPEDYVAKAEPVFVPVAKKSAGSDGLTPDQQQQLLFAKMLASKMAPVHIPLNRRTSQETLRRMSRDTTSQRVPLPVISVSNGEPKGPKDLRHAAGQKSERRRGSHGSPRPTDNDIRHDSLSKSISASIKNIPNQAAREKLSRVALPRKFADVVIASTPSIDSIPGKAGLAFPTSTDISDPSEKDPALGRISSKSPTDHSNPKPQSVCSNSSGHSNNTSTSASKLNSTALMSNESERSTDQMTVVEETWALATAGLRRPSDCSQLPPFSAQRTPSPRNLSRSSLQIRRETLPIDPMKSQSKLALHSQSNGNSQASKISNQPPASSRFAVPSCICMIS